MSITIDRASGVPSWVDRTQYPFTNHFVDVDGGRMHYVDEGSGEPIVFLHGLPTWSFIYRHLIRGLSPNYRCIAPDMIGFGMSSKPASWQYTALDQYHNFKKLLESLDLKRVTLVVHDLGAPIALSYATEHPEMVERLVVFNSWCWDLSNDPAGEQIARAASTAWGRLMLETLNRWPKIVRRSFGDRAKYTESFEKAISGPAEQKEDRHGLFLTAKNIHTSSAFFADVWAKRKELEEVPMLIIWGMKDPNFGEKALNKWWHEFPMASVQQLSTAGHFPMEEKPPEVLKSIKEFMGVRRSVSAPMAEL